MLKQERDKTNKQNAEAEIVYFHMPKVAGNSMVDFCEQNQVKYYGHDIRYEKYRFIKDYIKERNLITFTFVRNPWDRLVSAFFYLNGGGNCKEDDEDRKKYIAQYKGNFKEFIEKEYRGSGIFKQLHFKPQSAWISDRNKIIINYIGKIESFESDFKVICKKIGKKFIKIKKTNQSLHAHYRNYYDSRTQQMAYDMYKEDIELFNYEF